MIIKYSIFQVFATYLGKFKFNHKVWGLRRRSLWRGGGGSLREADYIGVPAQILTICRADGSHSRLLDFLLRKWAWPINSILCRVNGPFE